MRRAILPAVIFSAALVMAACGIQSYPYLAPPEDSSIRPPLEGESRFIFGNNTVNSDTYFMGYEIYYKFYPTDIADTSYDSETALLDMTPTLAKLEELNYHRLYSLSEDSLTKPLIKVAESNRNSTFDVTIDFTFLNDTNYPVITYLSNTLYAVRYVLKEGELTEGSYNFSPTYLTTDYGDFPAAVVNTDTQDVFLSLYVLTYGKYDVFKEFYSDAAHLGRIRLETSIQ